MVTPSTERLLNGAGRAMGGVWLGNWSQSLDSLVQAERAAMNGFQLPMARSIGAKARPLMIEEAMMMPAVAS